MKIHYKIGFLVFNIVPEAKVQIWDIFETRSERCFCHLVLEQATDLWISTLNREQFGGSKALMTSKSMFKLHWDTSAQKTSEITIFLCDFPKNRTPEKKTFATENDHLNK